MSPLLVEWLLCAVLLLTLSFRFPCSVSGRDAVGVDRLVCGFSLCGRSAIVGGLLTASGFMAFALVVSVWLFLIKHHCAVCSFGFADYGGRRIDRFRNFQA